MGPPPAPQPAALGGGSEASVTVASPRVNSVWFVGLHEHHSPGLRMVVKAGNKGMSRKSGLRPDAQNSSLLGLK